LISLSARQRDHDANRPDGFSIASANNSVNVSHWVKRRPNSVPQNAEYESNTALSSRRTARLLTRRGSAPSSRTGTERTEPAGGDARRLATGRCVSSGPVKWVGGFMQTCKDEPGHMICPDA
jgi:hypothetical protein